MRSPTSRRRHQRANAGARHDDLRFLARLRSATLAELEQMLRDHRKAPEWKRVAIQRALRRVTAEAGEP